MPQGPVASDVSSVALAAARADLERETLEAFLDDWCTPFPGRHLAFPHRQLMPAALRTIADFLKSTAGDA
ncbi:MAG TPA: hypothetical protein VHL31_23935 [Geminicoccus sp.]|jgi:DNA-binding transcriptional LysR family regulator|uniref:hypothetical protein n=1 Tax=Geminicoccus sp. TaxID=2024832 RepID=UPI002E327339|nr:hypothetical protein [Geminicoccus sp.]HEX2529330.1 hypothetical protein [Geminicoccus sp.]